MQQKSHRATSRQANAQFNTWEIIDLYISRLYYKTVFGSGIWLNFGSSQ